MATKKTTRLLTGLVAVLMLVSMFAAYTLPAVAEGVEDLPNVQEVADNPDAAGYIIRDIEDLKYVAENKGSYAAGKILYLAKSVTVTADYSAVNNMNGLLASIDGQGNTISGLTLTTAWLGNYATTGSIKNLTFNDCHLTSAANNIGSLVGTYAKDDLTFENITMTNCSATRSGSTTVNGLGLMIGGVNANKACSKVTFKNISISGCTLNRNDADNCGFLVGSFGYWNGPTETIEVDGVYLINNTLNGQATTSKTGRGIVFGEMTGTGSIKNVAVFNTTVSVEDTSLSNMRGIVIGGAKSNTSSIVIENVMACNNGSQFTNIVTSTAASTKATVSKVYSDATHLINGSIGATVNSTVYTQAQFASGEAAYNANTAIAADTAATNLKNWEMVENAVWPTFDTDGAGLPVAVTFNGVAPNDETTSFTKVLYTSTAKTLIGADEILEAAAWEMDVTAATTFGSDTTVKGDVVPTHEHNYTQVKQGADGKHTLICTASWDSVVEGKTFSCGAESAPVDCAYTKEYESVDKDASFSDAKHVRGCECGNKSAAENCELGEEVTVTESTVTEEGKVSRTCSVCNTTYYESTPCKMGLSVQDAEGYLNGKMVVNVDLLNSTGLAGAVLDVTYDPAKLELTEAKLVMTDVQANPDVQIGENPITDPETGLITVTLSFATAQDYKWTDLLQLTFAVKEDAKAGEDTLKIEVVSACDRDSKPVDLLGATGTYNLIDRLPGDVNDNGKITIADAVLLLRLILEGEEEMASYNLNVKNADIDGLDDADLKDVIYVLKYLNGSLTLEDLYAVRAA